MYHIWQHCGHLAGYTGHQWNPLIAWSPDIRVMWIVDEIFDEVIALLGAPGSRLINDTNDLQPSKSG